MRADEGDLEMYAGCYSRNGSPRTASVLRWRLLDNPVQKLWVQLAVAPDDKQNASVVATYGSQPVRARLNGRRVLAIQAIDAITEEPFRGRGLFAEMANGVYSAAIAGGARFVYGFPTGGASTRGHFARLGWTALDPVPFLVRPLRTGFVARRIFKQISRAPDFAVPVVPSRLKKGASLMPIARFGTEFDELWDNFAASIGVTVERDSTYLNWRLVDKPDESYERIAYYADGALDGFVAWVLKPGKHGANVGYIVELLHRPGRNDVGRSLLAHALRAMADAGGDLVFAWNFAHSPNHRAFLTSGFLPFPERLRPIELHVGARSFESPAVGAVSDRHAWYLSYCDSDTV